MGLVHVKLPEANVRNLHIPFPDRSECPGEWPRGRPASSPVRSGGTTSTLSDVDWARQGSNLVGPIEAVAIGDWAAGGLVVYRVPFPLEEEQGVFPPAFPVLLNFLGVVFGDGFL